MLTVPCQAELNLCALHSIGVGWGGAAALLQRALQCLAARRVHFLSLRGCLLAVQRPGAAELLPGSGGALLQAVCANLRTLLLCGHCRQLLPLMASHCTQLELLELRTAAEFDHDSAAGDSLVACLG